MGFRALMVTSSYRRDKPWPDWFIAEWGAHFHTHDGSTMLSPKYEIKNTIGFINDYHRALVEIGWDFIRFSTHGTTSEHAMAVSMHWDCGGVDVLRIWPEGPETYAPQHGEHCDHDWRRRPDAEAQPTGPQTGVVEAPEAVREEAVLAPPPEGGETPDPR